MAGYLIHSGKKRTQAIQAQMAPTEIPTMDKESVEELLQAQLQVVRLVQSHIGAMSLKCAVELGIPETIDGYGRPVTLSELMFSLPAIHPQKASCLRRLMRLLSHMGYFKLAMSAVEEEEKETYSLTSTSKILLKASPTSLASWMVGALNSLAVDQWQVMSEWFKQDQHKSMFKMQNGKSIWDLANEQPEFNRRFNDCMAGDSRIVVMAAMACKEVFQGVESLVDVGGGNGTFARAIAEAYPGITVTLYDLPHVIATVPESPLVEAVGGNMFDYIPQAQTVLMKWILHDWSDEDCVKILKNCKKVIPTRERGGKVIIIDGVLDMGNDDSKMTETKLFADIEMMGLTEGKEREEHEWKTIFIDAGFNDYNIISLGLRSLIEVFP